MKWLRGVNVDSATSYRFLLLREGVTIEQLLELIDGAVIIERQYGQEKEWKASGAIARPELVVLRPEDVQWPRADDPPAAVPAAIEPPPPAPRTGAAASEEPDFDRALAAAGGEEDEVAF